MIEYKKTWLLLFVLLLLSACSTSIKEEQKAAKENAYQAFQEESKKPNKDSKGISFYLPVGMEIDSSDTYNHIIKKGSKIYILFINPNEDEKSKVIYESTLKSADKYRLAETFTDDKKFGYIFIRDIEKDLYELIVGIGGIKMTTQTELGNLANDAKIMMEMVHSIQLKNE